MDRESKKNLVVALFVAVLSLSVGYAALSSSLNIKGTANVSGEKWQVNFVKDESTNTPSGQAKCNIGTIEDTSITDLSAVFKLPGDSCTFTVPVENTGTLSASLTEVLGIDSSLTFTGSAEDQALLESNIEYSVNYGTTEINDKTVFNNINTLEPGEKETVTLKVTFKSSATSVPKESVTVGGLDRTFVFENKQSTSVAESQTKYSINYEGFTSLDGLKTNIRKGTSYIQNFGEDIEICSVKMGKSTLSTSKYKFKDGVLIIENVTDDIIIDGYQPANEEPTTPNPPELNGDMIPVYYDNDWKKADVSNANNNWYDYNNQKWANAVTVKEIGNNTREYYKNEAPVGTIIPIEDINTMWVWIPRYSYTIKSEDGEKYTGKKSSCTLPTRELPGEIDIKFIPMSENDSTGTAQYTGNDATNWRTNDAFNFPETDEQGNNTLKARAGIWVGKFETTGSYKNTCKDETCDVSAVTILPNQASIQMKNISNFFYMSRSLQMNNAQTYGFDKNKGDLHMMKNDEWGAVVYLSQSRYGKYGNKDYSGANKEVYQNKSKSRITGSSNGTPPQNSTTDPQYAYNDMKELKDGKGQAGPGASTTGTIYGVYDMSGGLAEYVMAVLEYDEVGNDEHNGQIVSGGSGFKGLSDTGSSKGSIDLPNEKYYNKFKSIMPSQNNNWVPAKACNGGVCYGHALSETYNWYNASTSLAYRAFPFITRGNNYYCGEYTNPGVFTEAAAYGSNNYITCRLVLV